MLFINSFKIIKSWLAISFWILLCSCQQIPIMQAHHSETDNTAQINAEKEMQAKLQQADNDFAVGRYEQAATAYEELAKAYSFTRSYVNLRIKQARSLVPLTRYGQAETILRDSIAQTKSDSPMMAAEAAYELGLMYLQQDKDVLALSAFQDSLQFLNDQEVSFMHVKAGAKIATLYSRQGAPAEAKQWIQFCDREIDRLRGGKIKITEQEMTPVLFEMGTVNMNLIKEENFALIANGIQYTQAYLFRAMQSESERTRQEARDMIQNQMGQLWIFLMKFEANPPASYAQNRRGFQLRISQMGSALNDSIQQAKLWTKAPKLENIPEFQQVREYLEATEKNVDRVLYTSREMNILVPRGENGTKVKSEVKSRDSQKSNAQDKRDPNL